MKTLKNLSKQLKIPTIEHYCLACAEKISPTSYNYIFNEPVLCDKCLERIKPVYKSIRMNEIDITYLCNYESPLKEWLLQYKEQFDIALAPVFFYLFKTYIKLNFFNYVIVIAPSSLSSIKKREFSHMYEMCKSLNMPIYDILRKKDSATQKGKNALQRSKIGSNITSINIERIKDKKVLLIDDVITTGATIKACYNELMKGKPNKIKCLILMGAINQ